MEYLKGTRSDYTPLPVSEKQAATTVDSTPDKQQRPSSSASMTCVQRTGVALLLCGLLLWGAVVAFPAMPCHSSDVVKPQTHEAIHRVDPGLAASIPRLARRDESNDTVTTGPDQTGATATETDESSSSDPPVETSTTTTTTSSSRSTSSSSESSTSSEPTESSSQPPETSTSSSTEDNTPSTSTSSSDLPDTTLTTTTRHSTTTESTTTTTPSRTSSRSIVTTFTSTSPNGVVVTITDVTWVPADPTDTGSSGNNGPPTLQNVGPRAAGSVVAAVMAGIAGFAGMLLL